MVPEGKMTQPVTDPQLLALLNGGDEPAPVTDPALLAQLNGDHAANEPAGSTLSKIRDAIHAPTRILENGFLFGLGDRARAGMDTLLGQGQPTLSGLVTGAPSGYAGNLANERAQTDQFKTGHPVAAPIIEGVGGLANPINRLPLGAAAQGTSLGGKALYGAGAGAGLGGVLGALNTQDYTDVPQMARDAVVGAGTGGLLGGALPVAGAGVGAGFNWLADAIRSTPGISRSAIPHLIEAYKADGPAAVKAELDRLGPDATLADAGPALLGKAQGASLNSDEGRSVMQGTLTQRNQGTNQRIMGDVNSALGPAEDPQTVTNAIVAHRSAVDNAAYPAALGNAPDVKTAHILTQLDDMIPQSVGMEKKALTNLRGMLMTTEKQPVLDAQGIPQYDSLGRQKWQEVPVSQDDAGVLHKVKGELDNVIQYDAPGLGVPAGAVKNQQAALKNMRYQVNNALETQVPGYEAANRASAALAQRADAVNAGTQYLGSGKTTPFPERFAAEFDPLSQGEKIAFAKGSRGNIERILGTKANDLQALRSELQGEGGFNTAKLATVHGQDAADQLIGSVERNLKFRDTYNKVVENSQTAQRSAAAKAMKPDSSSETPLVFPGSTIPGIVGTVGKKAVGAAFNALLKKDPTKAYGEVARVLSAQGPQRDAYHDALVKALARRSTNAAASSKVGDAAALTALSVATAYARNRPSIRSQHK
jgi:hypothetical protein